jgi:hypothetical protein
LFTKEENCSTKGENLTNFGRGILLNFNTKKDLEKSLPSLIEIGLLVVLEKMILKRFFFNINTCENGFPYCGLILTPWNHDFTKLKAALYQESFM